MRESPIPSLLWCAAWALPTAVLTTHAGALGAALAAAGVLFALAAPLRARAAGLAALPAFLAAFAPPPLPPPPVAPGPQRVAGVVHAVQRAPEIGGVYVVVGDAATGLRLSFDADLDVLPGDRLAVLAHATAPIAPGLPPVVQAAAATAVVQPGPASLGRACAAARRACERQLLARVPGDAGPLLAALVLGRDTRPAGDVQDAHRATGLSHLLAVSGAHAAMLAFLLGLGGAQARRRPGAHPRRTALVLLLLAAYAAVTGNEPPVLRAVIAYTIAAVATHLGRPCGFGPLLLLPAVLTAFLQPDALLGPSFLLSYAAVTGLFLAGPARGDGRFARWCMAPLVASAWATLLTAPLTLWFFGQLAPWTVLLTPLLAPVVAALLLGGLALALCGCWLPWLADALATPLHALANAYLAAVQLADGLPGTPVPAAVVPPPWALLLAALAAVALVARRTTRARCAAAAALLVVPHFLPLAPRPDEALQLFAIGHGQACLVTTRAGHQCAIDCGSMQHPRLAADRLVAALPRRELDLLIVTHDDTDHHNGVPLLLTRLRVRRALAPAALAAHPLLAALRGHGAAIELLAPGAVARPAPHLVVHALPLPGAASDNDQSLWVSATIDGARVLATGDAQELGVATALAGGIATPHDVLVLPHHGRPNHNAHRLLAAVAPRVCLASAATADGETALGKLVHARGAELWVTGLHGALRVLGAPLRVASERPGRVVAATR